MHNEEFNSDDDDVVLQSIDTIMFEHSQKVAKNNFEVCPLLLYILSH